MQGVVGNDLRKLNVLKFTYIPLADGLFGTRISHCANLIRYTRFRQNGSFRFHSQPYESGNNTNTV